MSGGRTRFSRLPLRQKLGMICGYAFLCYFGLVMTIVKGTVRAARRFLSKYAPFLLRAMLEYKKKTTFDEFSESRLVYDNGELAPKDWLGLAGELAVFDLIRLQRDRRVVACNAVNFYCEFDLIYVERRSREIVFVEVKTRRREYKNHPTEEAVDAKRRKKMALGARTFVKERGYTYFKRRYDIAVVLWDSQLPAPEITITEGAFSEADALQGYYGDDIGKNRERK